MSRAPANARTAAQGAKPDQSDATKPTNPNPDQSVGTSQTGSDTIGGSSNTDTVTGGNGDDTASSVDTVTGAGLRQDTDLQGHASSEARGAREAGEGPAVATLGVNTGAGLPGSPPAESPGFSPEPAENTGDADSDKIPFTQAVQRLVPPDQGHPMAQALGVITNIPPGSAPAQIDPHAGLGGGAVSRQAAETDDASETDPVARRMAGV